MSLKRNKNYRRKSKNETKEDQLDLYEVPGSLFSSASQKKEIAFKKEFRATKKL